MNELKDEWSHNRYFKTRINYEQIHDHVIIAPKCVCAIISGICVCVLFDRFFHSISHMHEERNYFAWQLDYIHIDENVYTKEIKVANMEQCTISKII